MLQCRASKTCSGRALNEDMMDTCYTLLIDAGNGPCIRDGVGRMTAAASYVFPYRIHRIPQNRPRK